MKVNREREKRKTVLDRVKLRRVPYEYEAAKVYHEYLTAHPEKEPDDVKVELEYEEIEEDRYGHGGYKVVWAQVYEERDETDEEYEFRIGRAEEELVARYVHDLKERARQFRNEFADSKVVDDHWAMVEVWQQMMKLAKSMLQKFEGGRKDV